MVETSTDVPVRELPILAGQLALDFANTVDDPLGPARHDHIASYSGLLQWSERVDLLSPAQVRRLRRLDRAEPERSRAALDQAHELRSLLNVLFGDVAAGVDSTGGHWPRLRRLLSRSLEQAALERAPGGTPYTYSWPGTGPDVMLWPVVHAAADLLTSTDLARVKRCAGCPWLFLDQSKNASRRWCSMEDCGTHAKIRRYVERRAARRSTERPRP